MILDNLSTGVLCNINPEATFVKMDIRGCRVKELFMKEGVDYGIHEAT